MSLVQEGASTVSLREEAGLVTPAGEPTLVPAAGESALATPARGPAFDQIYDRIQSAGACLGIVGLGYVGLPLVPAAARAGYKVLGFDIDDRKVSELQAGRSYIQSIPSQTVSSLVAGNRFEATADVERLREADAILICVPTPLTRNRDPDLSYIVSSTAAIASILRPGQLIVLESTTYPGTTREVMRPILEQTGLKAGSEFFLAYSPEREDPGNTRYTTAQIPKVVSGDGPLALKLAMALYSRIVAGVVPVTSLETAEAVKLTENVFRAVNIALVNELKVIYAAMGIDIWEVIEAAKSKPFGYMPFYPGPGLGGHCLPIDPFYLTWKAREFGINTKFIELAGEINTSMPARVVDRVATALDDQCGRGLKGARILLLGVAYKKDINDIRESPALRIMQLLEQRGALADYHDPHVPMIGNTREHPELAGRCSVPLSTRVVRKCHAVIVCTDHSQVDYGMVVENAALVVDTRNVCRGLTTRNDNLVAA